MTTFALISEGVTDQVILEKIIYQICSEAFGDDLDVNPLQPLRDATDRATAAAHGGWELVFEYCEDRIVDALSANDYVVIHLDTDQGDHRNFGLHLTDDGGDRSYDALVADATAILAKRIGKDLYKTHVERLIFAISVHSMESWLLLYFFNRNEPKHSFDRLNRQLRKENRTALKKEVGSYKRIAGQIKRKRLTALSAGKTSFGMFLSRLAALKPANS